MAKAIGEARSLTVHSGTKDFWVSTELISGERSMSFAAAEALYELAELLFQVPRSYHSIAMLTGHRFGWNRTVARKIQVLAAGGWVRRLACGTDFDRGGTPYWKLTPERSVYHFVRWNLFQALPSHWREAVSENPTDSVPWMHLADFLDETGEPEHATEIRRRVMMFIPAARKLFSN